MKKLLTALIALLLPSSIARHLLNSLGHRLRKGTQIGFSLLFVDHLHLDHNTKIGHFNLIQLKRLLIRSGGRIGRGNLINGPLSVRMERCSEIGNRNKILRGPSPSVTYGVAHLTLGEWSKLTADHRVDCTSSVSFGSHSILAGSASQLWTHGYVHQPHGSGRYRIDGNIRIGHDVYIGSASLLTAGIQIADGVIIGAGTTVATSLFKPGLYVSAGLRCLDRPSDPDQREDLTLVNSPQICERVYVKRSLR